MSVPLQRPERDPVAVARLDNLGLTFATDAELAAAQSALQAADALKQDAATASTDAERDAAIAAAVAGLDATFSTDAERAAAVATLNASLAGKQDAATAATDLELAAAVGKVLPAPSGGDDLAALNNALLAAGRITAPAGAVYRVSGPVLVQSDTVLDLRKATLKFNSPADRFNLLNNAAVVPVASANDAQTTQGSSVVTSPTLAAIAQVGQALAVEGAGPPGGNGGGPIWLYGQILAVDDAAGTITLTGNINGVRAHIDSAGATAHLFNRDKGIEVIGGTFDVEDNWQSQADRLAAGVNSYPLRFRRVDGLDVYGQTVRMVKWTGGLGWANGVALGDVTDYRVENVTSDNASTTAAIDGPATRGVIRNMKGTTQDDLVALGCVGYQGQDVEGDIVDLEIDGLFPNNSWSALKVNAGTGPNGAQRVLRASARAIKGTTQVNSVQAIDYAGAGTGFINLLLDDVAVKPADGKQAIKNTAVNGLVEHRDHEALRYGYQAMTFPPEEAAAGYVTGSAFIHLDRIELPFDVLPTNLDHWVTTAGATLTAGRNFLGIFDAAGNLRYKSADMSGIWTSIGPKRAPLTLQDGQPDTLRGGTGAFCWVAWLANGTTAPTFAAKTALTTFDIGLVPGAAPGPYVGTIAANALRTRAGYLTVGARTDIPASIANDNFSDNNVKSLCWAAIL